MKIKDLLKEMQLVSSWQSLKLSLGLSAVKAKPRTEHCKLLGSFGRQWGKGTPQKDPSARARRVKEKAGQGRKRGLREPRDHAFNQNKIDFTLLGHPSSIRTAFPASRSVLEGHHSLACKEMDSPPILYCVVQLRQEIYPLSSSRCALWVTWEHGLERKIVKLGLFETISPFLRNNRNQNSNPVECQTNGSHSINNIQKEEGYGGGC